MIHADCRASGVRVRAAVLHVTCACKKAFMDLDLPDHEAIARCTKVYRALAIKVVARSEVACIAVYDIIGS